MFNSSFVNRNAAKAGGGMELSAISFKEEDEPVEEKRGRARYDFEFLLPVDPDQGGEVQAPEASTKSTKGKSGRISVDMDGGIAELTRTREDGPNPSDDPYDMTKKKGPTLNERLRNFGYGTRATCQRIVVQRWFSSLIMTLIFLGTLLLALDSASLDRDESDAAEKTKKALLIRSLWLVTGNV